MRPGRGWLVLDTVVLSLLQCASLTNTPVVNMALIILSSLPKSNQLIDTQ